MTKPPGESPDRARTLDTAAASFVAIALVSLFVASTASTLWVPLLTGNAGSMVFDGFWTPLLTWLGAIGTATGVVGRVAVAVIRRR